jgi:TetR/AcrR family transcriptional repressor of nem operon
MRKGEQTRQHIICKAAPIFNQKGYAGTSLSDLMDATGLEKGGIYRHFENKQELAADAFDHAWKTAMEIRFDGIYQISHAIDRLKQIVRNFLERRDGLVAGGCPLLNTAVDTDDGNPHLRTRARRALVLWLDRLRLIIEQGQEQGQISSDVDALQLATLIVSTLEGSLMVSRLQQSGAPLEVARHHLEEYFDRNARSKVSRAERKSDDYSRPHGSRERPRISRRRTRVHDPGEKQ